VLGPLPPFYRIVVSLCALLACVGIGAWLAYVLPVTAVASTGAGIGLGIGAIVVILLLHDFDDRGGHPHRVRVRR
jgi:hypothetical protein